VNLLRPYPAVSVNPAVASISLNGAVGIRIEDEVGGTTIVSVVVEAGRITRIFAMRNPHKLTRLDSEARLTR
jgi:RNA polymerase sigma-70 factor (ECF subfamily)